MKKITFILFFFTTACYSQNTDLHFSHLSRANGLSNSTIQTIVQDSKGFIWIGTENGLNKYDGYQFHIYNKENANRKIGGNVIYHMLADRKHRLWVMNSYGISLYNEKLNTFIDKYQTPVNSNVNFIFESQDNRILAAMDNGIFIYDEAKQIFKRFNPRAAHNTAFPSEGVKCIYQDKSGKYWIGTKEKGVFLYSNDFRLLKHLDNSSQPTISGNDITSISGDKEGFIWVGYLNNGVDQLDTDGRLVRNFVKVQNDPESLPSNVISCITVDSKNNVWIGSENGGLSLFNRSTQKFRNYINEIENTNSISQKTVSCIFEDNQSNIWVGTHRGGINISSPLKSTFRYYTQGIGNHFLSFKDVKYFCEANNGDILIGTDGGGLNTWNRKNGTFTYHMNNPRNSTSISSNAVLCVMEDSEQDVWVGTWGGGINKFSRLTGQFARFVHDQDNPNSISSNNIWDIMEDGNSLWIGTYLGGVNIYDKQTKIFKQFVYNRNKTSQLYGKNIGSLEKDREGNIWIGTVDGGLNCYNPKADAFEHYFLHHSGGQLVSTQINSIFSCKDGNLWVATVNGLYKFDFLRRAFIKFDDNRYLSSVVSINEDNSGNLWCGTRDGLIKINKTTKRIYRYTGDDGLQGPDFNPKASLKLRSGELLFGGYNGFNVFNPENILPNNTPPKVYLTNFSILNESIAPSANRKAVLKQQIFNEGKIILNHSQASLFSFEFAALNYISTNKNEYSYKLEGFDDNWNYLGNQRKITFTNLDPGEYTLLIRASNNDAVWNLNGARVDIEILPPFWKTAWFRLLAMALFLTILYIYFKMYKNLLSRKIHERKQEEMYNMKLDFFTHISHEFRTPLTLISGIAEKLSLSGSKSSEKSNYNQLLKNANRLTGLIKELMDFRKAESGVIKLQVSEGNFEDAILQLSEDFLPIAERKNIQFNIDIENTKTSCWFDKKIMEKITLNILNNAFKYCDSGDAVFISVLPVSQPSFEHSVSFGSKRDKCDYKYLVVKDDGKGIPVSSIKLIFDQYYRMPGNQMGSGIGLALVKSLTLLHHGTILLSSEENKGTEIIIGIPCNKKDYAANEITTAAEEAEHQEIENLSAEVQLPDTRPTDVVIEKNQEINSPGTPLVLIIDDNDDLRAFLKDTLQNSFLIEEAANGEEGLQKIREINPSLIITDIMMPKMDGIEMTRIIKQDKALKHIPVIMLTAKDGDNDKIEGLSTGADYYFTKPLSIKLLLITINNIFDRNKSIKLYYLKDYQTEIRNDIHNAKDKELMDTVLLLLEDHLEDPDLHVEFLCRQVGMSQSKFYKEIKRITGRSINEFIRYTRLKKAVFIMNNEDVTINEVMNRVGVQSPSYFTKAFAKEFGKTPSQYMKQIKELSYQNQ